MAHPWHHAVSSSEKYGGVPEDYLGIHQWFDESKAYFANFRHRAMRHHAQGIFECEKIFGATITNSTGKVVPTRFVGEQHVREDCGGLIPSIQDWLQAIPAKRWMSVGKLSGDFLPENYSREVDFSLETWRATVLAGETILGYSDWRIRFQSKNAADAG